MVIALQLSLLNSLPSWRKAHCRITHTDRQTDKHEDYCMPLGLRSLRHKNIVDYKVHVLILSVCMSVCLSLSTLSLFLSFCSTISLFLQRNDIVMAIAWNNMFDFLIDVVPQEEIQNKSKPSSLANTATARLSQVKCWSGIVALDRRRCGKCYYASELHSLNHHITFACTWLL